MFVTETSSTRFRKRALLLNVLLAICSPAGALTTMHIYVAPQPIKRNGRDFRLFGFRFGRAAVKSNNNGSHK